MGILGCTTADSTRRLVQQSKNCYEDPVVQTGSIRAAPHLLAERRNKGDVQGHPVARLRSRVIDEVTRVLPFSKSSHRRSVCIGVVSTAAQLTGIPPVVFLEVNKPQPVVLYELMKGWLTRTEPELGKMHTLKP